MKDKDRIDMLESEKIRLTATVNKQNQSLQFLWRIMLGYAIRERELKNCLEDDIRVFEKANATLDRAAKGMRPLFLIGIVGGELLMLMVHVFINTYYK